MPNIKTGNNKVSDEEFITAVKTNRSIRQTLLSLKLNETGSAYNTFKRRIKRLNIDISHFLNPKTFLKPWSHKKRCLEEILVEHSTYTSSYDLKNRLIKENLLHDRCSNTECQIKYWHGKQLNLHIDHINGISDDNRIENLRLLCPNCHSLTSTYAGKNKGKQNL